MNKNLPAVAVLMSTYNGEMYIREQIDSILIQKDVYIQLLIRDDGSTDKTISICKEYEKNNSNIKFYQGMNVGVGESFMELLGKTSKVDYYSFADQDDVWLDDKLIRAINYMDNYKCDDNKPTLYASNLTLVNDKLEPYAMRFLDKPQIDLVSQINVNKICGCTMVMNNELRNILVDPRNQPDHYTLHKRNHDAWIMLIATIFGKVVYDDESHILYRQHSNQTVGVKKEVTGLKKIRDKYIRLKTKKYKGVRSNTAKFLLKNFKESMSDSAVNDLEIVAKSNSLIGMVKLMRNKGVKKSLNESNVSLIIKSILGWI